MSRSQIQELPCTATIGSTSRQTPSCIPIPAACSHCQETSDRCASCFAILPVKAHLFRMLLLKVVSSSSASESEYNSAKQLAACVARHVHFRRAFLAVIGCSRCSSRVAKVSFYRECEKMSPCGSSPISNRITKVNAHSRALFIE